MLQPRRTLLLYLTIVILATCDLFFRNVDCETEIDVDIFDSEDGSLLHEPSKVDRVKRDVGDVTTVLLVDNTGRHRDGRFHKKAVGLLTSTARTFVQEGTTTEFATEVLGTTLDNGRLYAQVVTTSSRVFYNGDSKIRDKTRTNLDELVLPSITLVADIARPTQPIQVLQSQVEESVIKVEPFSYAKSGNIYQTAVNGQQTPHSRFIGVPPRADDDIISVSAIDHKPSDRYEGSQVDSRDELEALFLQAKAKKHVNKYLHPAKEDERQESENLVKAKRMEYFKKKNTGDVEGQDTEINNLKPARVVKPLDDLPTFTVRHEFAPSGFSVDDNEEDSTESRNLEINPRGNRSRSGKAFFGGNRIEQRKLDTVTYLGFSEFTTTVGDTVIIFMPHTTAAVGTHQGRKATSISGDATLAPELQHVTTENQVSVVTSVKTFMSHTPGMVTRTVTGHSLSMQTALPTMVVLPEIPSQTVTIRRDHKALQSVHVVDPITENPTDFEDAAQYLAHEQLEMAERIPTTPAQDLITEQFFDIDTIQPSSVSHNDNIEPSIEDIAEASSVVSSTEEIEVQSTDSLATFYTAQTQLFDTGGAEFPLGLIKVIGGTEAINGTTTLFTSLIYGTYVDGNYAQVIHSTSSVFFYIDHTKDDMRDTENTIQPTAVLDTSQNSVTHITLSPPETTSSDAEETKETIPPTTPPLNVDSTDEPPQTTEGNLITTIEQSTTEDDNKRTTAVDETLSTAPTEETKTESDIDSINEVETGRKINLKAKEQEVIFEKDAKNIEKDSESQIAGSGERHLEDSRTPPSSTTDGPITQLIPTTVYKTFTYLTTFFIPAQGTSTTTSIRSREVTSSEISYITQTFNSDANKSTGKVDLKHNISTDSSSVVVSPTVSLATEENFDTTTDSIIAGTTNQNGDTMATPELPEEKTTLISEEMSVTTIPATTPRDLVQGEEDEIELIFKTLYTTYTYLTTFFQESTTSVSSREVVVTNVVTSTVDSSYILHASDPAVAGLFASDETLVTPSKHLSSIEPVPTSVGTGRPTTKYFPDLGVRPDEDLFSTVIESVDIEKELATPTPALNYDGGSGIIDNELKTFYTTYTYFTTILVDGETEISSRTEIYTNIVTPSGLLLSPTVSNIEPTISLREPLFEKDSNPDVLDQLESPQKHAPLSHFLESSQDSPHIETPVLKSTPHYSYSSTIFRSHKLTSDGNESSNINTVDVDDEENSIFQRNTPRFDSSYATISRSRDTVATPTSLEEDASTKSPISSREIDSDKSLASVAVTKSVALDTPDVADKMSTVTSSSSDGRKVMMLEKRNDKQPLLDDQISSESNTEQLEPSPTLLLQTSYTTFTYFTTIYKGSSSSDVVSRLETVTNVVTETLSPSDAPTTRIALEDATLPITYFTTFTYWTTLYKDGSTVVTSREETISNTVTPTVIPSPSSASVFEISPTPASAETAVLSPTATLAEPTTFFTTYTYFTTSYIGNSTVLSSRLETVTNIVNDTANDVTGRAIGSGASEQNVSEQITKTESPVHSSLPLQPTGLLSTILTSEVNNGTTILFSTDVYGTFIDGLYAQVLESSTQIVTSPPVSSTKVNLELKPTGVVSLNEGRIVDADGVSTTYFTTRAIGTYIDTLYAEVVESTTTIKVNTERQSILAAISPSTTQGAKAQRTGLVRIVEGSIVKDETTTFYESRVVGTLIDGRYAQIIESTSSFKVAVTPTSVPGSSAGEIAATSTLSTDVTVIPTVSSTTSPSPAVIESSLSEGSGATEGETEDDGDSGEDNEGDDAGKNRKKSRLTFSTRKRTFTPQIRPFASRNRPTFNPKRKTALGSSATTITRATVTPTVTATPAAKTEINGAGKGRFSSNRRGNSSGLYKTIHNDIRPTPSGASARRTSRIRGSPVSSAASSFSTHYTGRGRSSAGSSRLYATSTPGQNGPSRRGGFYRSSSSRVAGSSDYPFRGSTSVSHHGASSSRFRIRPTQSSLLGRTGSTAFTTPSTEETIEPDDDLTTIVTDETPHFTDDEHDSPTQPISTTTESSRRSNNPLLRFRRPPTLRAPQTTSSTPKPTTTQSSRRSPLLRRPASERGATTAKPRTTNKYNPVTNRQRPGNNLFPPRGLLKKPEKEDEEETKEGEFDGEEQENEEIKEEQDNEEDIDDNEYEESETKESKTQPNKSANRRSDKPYNPVNIRPFVGFNRKPRTKRQVEYGTKSGMGSARGFTPRYRRPGVSTRSPQESVEDPEPVQDTVKPKPSNPGRFTPRPRTSTPTQPRVRPTSVSSNTGRSQFTLRKEDTSTNNRANFRRPTTASPRRRTNIKPPEPTTSAQRPKPPRLRTQSNTRQSEATTHSWSNTRRNPNTSRRGSTRTRYRGETSDFDTYTYSQSSFDGSITVTHHIPTEVTIPVVNGRVTEYRNVITASASTEVLGPHQYTVSTAKDGNTVLYLTSEVTGTLPSGVTEITQFLIHETPTTSVIFTPTTIRGHKTSYSHIIPSTVYDVEQVVNTLQPQVSPNAPLANILLSQLLLGNLGLQPNLNPLLALNNPGPPSTPTTEFKTRQTTYVTTVTKGTSTVIPLTFRGKEILTTIVDSSTEVITATEFITDTIVVTPTAALGAGSNQLNSLLLPALLQAQLLGGQPQQQSMVQNPLLSGLQQQLLQQEPKLIHDTSLENTAPEQPLRRRQRPPEEQDRLVRDSEKEILDDDVVQVVKDEDTGRDRSFKTSRTKSRTDKKPPDPPPIPAETSVVTLYVSGRRPGEFSTVISTVTLGDESSAAIRKREAGFAAPEMFTVEASQVPEIGGSFPTSDDGYLDNYVMSAMNEVSGQASETETQSLESIVGDVSSYVSSVIGQSSSSSKLLVLRSSSTENPTPFSTENKKKLPAKKTNPSSFNSSYSTGHFLSNGPAEFAPLKRKVINKENRGMLTMLNDNKQNVSKANVQSKPKYENSTCAMVFEKREFLRKKRSTEDNLDDKDNGSIHSEIPSHRRRKVRIKVPINRMKLSEDKSVNKEEILTLSEAQHSARVPNMDIGAQHIEKHEHEKTSPQPEYGSRMESIIYGQEPVTSNSHEEGNNHQRRKIFVTRRKKTEHSTVSGDLDDYSISSSVPANTPDRAQDFLVITTYRPKEIPFFVSSNVAVDEKDLYLLPTTVRGNKVVMNTTSGRRRIVVTRKRPIIMTPTQRRRIVVTKKRPVPNFDLDIEPTNVIPESMSTIYSYKYTVLNRDKELSTDTENMVKVSQVFMSGGVNHEVYDDREIIEESKKKYEETPTSLETDIRVEKSKTEQNSNVLISKQASNGQQSLIPTSNFPVTEMSTQRLITIQPSQIESSFKISTHDLENETLTFGVSTQDLPLEISSLKISSLTLANNDIIKSQGATSVLQPENDYNSVNTDIKHEKEEHKKNIQGEENEYSGENKEDDQTHNRATIASYEFTTESPSITEDSLFSITEESSFDGPRFVRPTRFSITKRPGRIKTTFPGRRQTSVLTPTSTTGSNSIHSSSGNYKSYYRGRQPLTSSRTFGRSSKTHTHLYTTATTNVPTEPVPHFDDSPSYNLSNSPSSALFDDSSLSIHTSSESPSESSPTPSSITPVPATTASSHTVVPDISSTVVMETVMSTRLRTYTYIVARVAGQEQVVTSTTEVKPHVTTFIVTKTLPVLATEMNGPEEARGLNVNGAGEARYNLATKVMSNGVEVIVAGDRSTLPGEPQVLRVLSSSLSHPITLAPSTLTDHMVLFLPHESSQVEAQLSSSLQHNVFATNTYLTTYTYLTTFLQDGVTTVSSNEKIVSNVVTEERTGTNTITPTPITALTLSASPFLSTGVFHTTYTYLNTLIDGDVPLVVTSQHTVTNTLTAPHDYLLQLQPSGQSTFDTNTYLSTVAFTKTLTDGTDVKIVSTEDILTQVVITESNKKATEVKGIVSDNRPAASHSSLQQGSITNVVKTYFVTYTYFSTFLEGGSTVIRTNIATSSDVVTEKFYVPPKRTMPPSLIPTKSKNEIKVTPTSKIDEKIDFQKQSLHLYATKTYLTTFTYFTTLLQDGGGDHISTIVSSRTRIVQNVVTESVDSSLLDPEYLDSLRSSIHADSVSSSSIVATATLSGGQELKITAMNHNLKPTLTVDAEVTPTSVHHELSSSMEEASDNVNNIIKGSTIIFFDEEDQIDSSSTSQTLAIEVGGHTKATPSLSSVLSISMIQSTALNTEGTTALFSQDTPGAQPLVSSPTPALQESATTVLPNSLPITFSPVSYLTSILATSIVTPSGTTLQPGEQVIMMTQHGGNVTMIPVSDPANKKPTGGIGPGGSEIEVSDLLSLGSLGINGLNALGPVINAMAGLIQSNLNNDKRRNDTSVIIVPSTTPKPRPAYYGDNSGNPLPIYVPPKPVYPQDHESTTPVRSPIYIPVGAVAGDDTEDVATAESQRYEGITNLNGDMKWPQQGFPDTNQRRPVDSAAIGRPIESALLGDGIPISPGQVITANSDVIVGKPAIMGPRPPKINGNKDEIPLGMKPPPPPASTVWSNRDTPSGHTPIREHGSGHIPLRETFPPPPNRNHAPLRDHVPLREHGYHSSSHHHPSEDDIPLLPPPVVKPDISGHLPNVHENYSEEQIMNVPAKASAISDLQTVFQGKPVNQGIDIIHGNPIQVFGQTEPISLDRSSGIPLLVNIQPSQVANVIIPHGGSTAAHTFSDQGNGFYDPAPHPLPESSPGFVEIGGPENESHNIHPEYHASHDSQVSGTRMDLPPQEPENIGHINDHTSQQGINVEISPGQGVNVDVSPGHGINVDVSPGQGINVDVSPGQGLNVEIAPGHYSLNGEHVSPSGIVLDVPLQGRPGTPNRRPTPNVHSHHHRPTWPPTQQLPPPPPPAKHHPTSSTSPVHGHSFPHHPMPPTDFMIPPPPPHTHFKPDSFHNSGNFHGPAIPLNPTGLHPPGPKTQDHIIQSDGNDVPTEVEGGEVMQESNQRPLRPGQIPVEVLLANSASTHRPIIVRPGTMLGAKHDEVLHQMKPPQSMFDQPPQPDRPLKPNPENRPYKPNYKETPYIQITEQRPHHTKPQPNFDNRPHSTNVNGSLQQFRPNEGPQLPNSEEIPEHSRPEVVIEGRPHTSNNWNHVKQKPVISYTDGTSYSVQPQSHQSELSDSKLNTNSEQHPQNSKHDENSHFNKTLEINFGGANMNHRPQQPIFDKHDDLNKLEKPSTSEPLYDLETQANTPRPFSILPSVPKQPDFDFNTDELVVGLAPPPRVTPGGSNGQRFPMLSIEPQVSSHRPVVNIGNHRRPPIRTKPPPYKFELPPTTEPPTTIQKTSDKRPFWIRPPLQEISIPISTYTENVTKPNEDENKNLIKKPSLPQDSNYTHRRPITTWRPPLSSDRPRPPRPSTSEPTESIYSHTSAATDDVSIGPNSYTITGGADKPLLPDSTPVLQTVVIGKPIPKEPVISPTAVKDSEKRKTTYSTEGLWNEDIIIGSESPGNIPHSQGHATPSENIQKKKTSMLSATTTLISIGSKTIFGNLFTKPSTVVVNPSKIAEPTQSTSLVSDHHKENESFYHSNTDSDDDDDDAMGFENKDHKPDLGIASSNDDKIIFSSAAEIPTHYVTHTHTHTVTLTETTVMSSHGHQPSTRTVVVTKTQIFTHVDTVTETEFHTLVHPTSVVATVTTTVSATSSVYAPASPFDPANYPTFPVKPLSTSPVQDPGDKGQEEQVKPSSTSEGNKIHMEKNSNDVRNENITGNTGVLTGGADENESFFVVVNDQKPATININKGSKSGEDYNEVANHDESDPNSKVNHAVLLGGVLIAAPPHHNTPSTHFNNRNQGSNSCRPDCSAARNELCQKVEGRMSCVCRPGFARMFPDRPCRPTYTYKMKVGLARHGKETLHYGSSLEDTTSSHYQQLTEAAREGLDRMVMQSDLRDIYHGVVVNGFQPADKGDGVTVNFYVQLSDNIEETRLQDVFKKSLRTSNYSLGSTEMFANRDLIHHIKAEDFDECESRQFHDCSEHAQCFNLRGTYTCSCQDGYTDLSENSLFPGRVCSAEQIGCEKCHYHGTCYSRGDEQLMCECFQWYAGENCHINLKVLLIALVTIGAILLGLLIVCVVLTCLKRSSQQACSTGTGFLRYRSPTHTLDKRAMIQDSSSEGSAADHGPVSYLTPTHQPASTFGSQMKPALVHAGSRKVSGAAEFSDEGMTYSDQRDRSLTVMIPRAKYRPIPPTSPLLAMSTFGAEQKRAIAQEQQKLLNYLETGKQENRNAANKKRKQSNSTNQTNETAPPPSRKSSAPRKPSTGALVSAGFEVSATVGHKEPGSDTDMASAAIVHGNGGKSGDNNHNTLASSGSHFTTLRTNDSETNMPELVAESTTDSHLDTNSRVQELTVSEARSFDETTVQPPTKSLHSNYGSNPSSRNPNDEAHTMAERDLGSTLLMPQTHLYKPDRGSDISNFDSL